MSVGFDTCRMQQPGNVRGMNTPTEKHLEDLQATRKAPSSVEGKDASVLAHIQRLASEEHRLLEGNGLGSEESRRLAALQTELDQCWDLLRQRRALREFGGDASQARARDADVVKRYVG
jgi:hypothetical protein